MRHSISDIFRLLTLSLIVIVGLSACSDTKDDPNTTPEDPYANYSAGFTIVVSSETASSRAPQDGEYNPGSEYENYINIFENDYRFLFFDSKSKKCIGIFKNVEMLPLETSQSSKKYFVSGILDREVAKHEDLKIVVLANWHDYKKDAEYTGLTIDEICQQRYTFTRSVAELSEVNTIPLYGVKSLGKLQFTTDKYNQTENFADLGVIHLLRAYAKIDIKTSGKGMSIVGASIDRYNTKGFCAPHGIYEENQYVKDSWELDYTAEPSVPNEGQIVWTNLEFFKDENSDYWYIYVPEYINVGDSAQPAKIKIRFKNEFGTVIEDFIEFKDYTTNTAFNLMRNVWYRYTVTKYDDISVEVDVVPYSGVWLNPDFGIDRD